MEITPETYRAIPDRVQVIEWPSGSAYKTGEDLNHARTAVLDLVASMGGKITHDEHGKRIMTHTYGPVSPRPGDRIVFHLIANGVVVEVESPRLFSQRWEREPTKAEPKPVNTADTVAPLVNAEVPSSDMIDQAIKARELLNETARVLRDTEPPQVGLCVLCYTSNNPPQDTFARYVVGGIGVCRAHVDQAIEES